MVVMGPEFYSNLAVGSPGWVDVAGVVLQSILGIWVVKKLMG